METIFIPRVSVLMKDREIFTDLSKFSAVTGHIPTIPTSTSETNSEKKENRFSTFQRSVRNSVLRPPRGDYNIISNEEYVHTLLAPDIRSGLKERKKLLVQTIKKHEAALLELRNARIQCWKSEAKTKQYQLMIETQKSALIYNPHETGTRTAALKDTETELQRWMAKNEKDNKSFGTKLLTEIKYRENIQKISTDIETNILRMLDSTIRNLMNHNKQNISEEDICKCSHRLYRETCRIYKFGLVENVPCQKEWIEKPKYENSILNGTDIEKRIRSQGRLLDNNKIE